jgi:hypothetical protein
MSSTLEQGCPPSQHGGTKTPIPQSYPLSFLRDQTRCFWSPPAPAGQIALARPSDYN